MKKMTFERKERVLRVIIAGDGKVGATLTRKLSLEGYEITLIDSNPNLVENTIEQYDVNGIHGNSASMQTLEEAGIMNTDLLIAVTSADEVNLLACMTAHALNPDLHTIARIRNPDYYDQIYRMRSTFALSMMVNPEKQTAMEIERLLKYPGFLKRESFAKGRVEIVELRIDEDSRLCNVPLMKLQSIVRCKVLVCAVLRNGESIAPKGDFVLQDGDRIFVTAPTDSLMQLLKSLDIVTHKVNRVMLAGGGRISYYLAELLRQNNVDITIVEQNERRCAELCEALPKARIVCGDASNMRLLLQEGMLSCDALVALTGYDEINMVISLFAKRNGIKQVITKLGRVETIDLTNELNLGSVVCPKDLCCNTIVRYVRAIRKQTGAALTVHSIADGQAEAIEFLVDDHALHCGEPLKQLRFRKNVLIACIHRDQDFLLPNGESTFRMGDIVVVVASGSNVLYRFNDIFE